jgi:hypothetical protein
LAACSFYGAYIFIKANQLLLHFRQLKHDWAQRFVYEVIGLQAATFVNL